MLLHLKPQQASHTLSLLQLAEVW